MSEQDDVYRVIVRGRFDGLDDARRAALLAVAHEHDVLTSGTTDEGTLAYDRALDFFSFRVRLTARDERAAQDAALRRAGAALDGLGADYRGLKAVTTNASAIRVRRKR
jgi:hypothetical protein